MKKKYVTVGVRGGYWPKYDDGKCRICVWALHGEPDAVKLAEKHRRQLMQNEAERLYWRYMEYTHTELDEWFRYYGVSCLSELIEAGIRQNLCGLFVYSYAEAVLAVCGGRCALNAPCRQNGSDKIMYGKA